MLAEFVRTARRFREMTDDGFLCTYSLEFARLCGTSPSGSSANVLPRMFDLHRRHGDQVVRVLEDGLAQYKQQLSKGLMAPGSLLTFVVAEQAEDRRPVPEPKHGDLSSAVQLMIDADRGEFSVNSGPALRGRRSVALLAVLAEQHRADTLAGRRTEMFAYIPKDTITRELGAAEDALRRPVERLRDRIAKALASCGIVSTDRELVIQSQQWKGYRLNPVIHLVLPN